MSAIPYEHFPSFMTMRMSQSFHRDSDIMPVDRFKINHAQGVVARFSWENLGGHAYTGLYNENF